MDNQRRYRRPNSDVKEDKMDQREQEQRPVRREYGSSAAADSIGQARRVIDQLEARINDARRVPMSKTLSIVDAGELIDLIGQLRIVLPHTVVQAQAILEQQKQILGEAKAEADRTADKADEIYTTTVEKAKQFEQEVKADADAYDKQIRQKAQEDSNAIIEDANTRANQIIFSAQQQSQKLVDDNEITRRAQAYAVETRERAEKDADSIRMIGIPPPQLASNKKLMFFALAISISSGPCFATSALFDVQTLLPDSSARFTKVYAGSIPPITSTTISTSGSFTITS